MDALDYLISCDLDLTPDHNKKTVLMQACRASHHLLVAYLLKNAKRLDLDLNTLDAHGENSLFYAMRSQNLQIIKLLLSSGIRIESNIHGVNVLSQCMSEQRDDIVAAILNSTVDISRAVNGKDTRGRSLFHHCITKGDFQMLAKLSKYYDRSLDGDVEGVTILMKACQQSNIDLLTFLVEDMKVDLQKTDLRNKSAIFYAIESSNLPAVTYLLEKMEKLEDDHEGRSVLTIATIAGDLIMAEQLVISQFGKDLISRKDKIGRNLTHYCALLGRDKILSLFLNFGLEIDIHDDFGATAIMLACAQGYYTLVAFLLRNGSLVDTADKTGRRPLHYCFGENPSLKCVKILINYGADPNDSDASETTPIMLACRTCSQTHIAIISYLLHKGADPCLQDVEGKDSFDHSPFNAEYVKGMMRRIAGKSW